MAAKSLLNHQLLNEQKYNQGELLTSITVLSAISLADFIFLVSANGK